MVAGGSTRFPMVMAMGDGQLVREEHGAHDELADVAAAGDAGHAHGGQHGHNHHQCHVADAVKGPAEHAEEERYLQNAREAGAIHVHGGAQRNHDLADILGDTGGLRLFHVGGDGGHGGAGAQGSDGRFGDVPEHFLDRSLAAAEPGEQGEGHKNINEAEGIVHHQSPGIVRSDLGAVGGHQVGEEAEEGDGGVVGD